MRFDEVVEILSHFHWTLNLASYICGVQLTVGVWLTVGFPSQNPGVRGGGGSGTMSIDIADVPNPLRVTDFHLTEE